MHRGSIPACAGEPKPRKSNPCKGEVYPRLCGGTGVGAGIGHTDRGLSPPVRGNPASAGTGRIKRGSIPACAGEPCPPHHRRRRSPVYPRLCGGTFLWVWGAAQHRGLSPPVRGNRMKRFRDWTWLGSIPACAGEPHNRGLAGRGRGVYPRLCGGTFFFPFPRMIFRGLSPPVRGNLAATSSQLSKGRSIPACAGEPRSRCRKFCKPWVYPRLCGGTAACRQAAKP